MRSRSPLPIHHTAPPPPKVERERWRDDGSVGPPPEPRLRERELKHDSLQGKCTGGQKVTIAVSLKSATHGVK